MPTKTSQYFNFTFRPTSEEFRKYNEDWLDKFQRKFSKEKYLVSYEKGTADDFNHLQGFIEFRKNKRADTLRKSFDLIMKDMTISYPKVALKVSPVIRDVSICQGYILKEYKTDDLDKIINNGYEMDYLINLHDSYLKSTIVKKLKVDKIRVNSRNFYVVYCNYVEGHKEVIKKYGYNLGKTKDTEFVMKRMVQDGYYMFDLLLNPKRFTNIAMNVCLLYNDDIGDGQKRIIN